VTVGHGVFKKSTQARLTLDNQADSPLLSVLRECGHRAKAIELFEEASEAGVAIAPLDYLLPSRWWRAWVKAPA
jgi:hypothetical protein